MNEENKDPEAPLEVQQRQAKARALTPQTAELIGSKEYQDDAGRLIDTNAVTKQNVAAKAARLRAESYAGGTPVAGLTPTKVAEIKGRDYPQAPKMDCELGDRTPAFVNWLWANKPADAKVRYAYRDIWPTALPLATWPPKAASTLKNSRQRPKPAAAPSAPVTSAQA